MQLATPEISHEIEGAVQIPHPLEDSGNQIPSSPGRQKCQMPGVCPGGGMLKLQFDRYTNAIKIASRFFGAQPLTFQNNSSFLSLSLIVSQGLA